MEGPETQPRYLTPSLVARRLNVTTARVRQLDPELAPLRTLDNRRLYRERDVERVAGRRDARTSARKVIR